MADRTPADLLQATIAANPSRPLVTFYDDASGERIELSAKLLGNWVAKTANLLVDGLDAQTGDRVALALPPHWQSMVWLLACWSAGLVAIPLDPAEAGIGAKLRNAGADIVAVTEEFLPAAMAAGVPEVVGLSLDALGAPLADCPPGVTDYAVDVRSYGDVFTAHPMANPDEPILTVTNHTVGGAELVRLADEAVRNWDLNERSRILTDLPLTTLDTLIAVVLAPLRANGSVIIQRNLDKTTLNRRISVEHVTAVAGVIGWNAPSGHIRRLV